MEGFDFTKCGGVAVAIAPDGAAGEQLDSHQRAFAKPEEFMWDFGRKTHIAGEGARLLEDGDLGRKMSGRWDGKTNISLFLAATKIKHYGKAGSFLPAQWQPRGTCVGRGASGLLNTLQPVMILNGAAFTFKPVSHAWMYAGARMQYNDIHSWQDGAVGKGALEFAGKPDGGVAYQDEVGDTDYYKDDIAANWAYNGIPAKYRPLGTDNLVKDAALVTSAEVLADLIASGGGLTVASNRGFTMSRDAEGVSSPSGTWNHQMYIGYVGVTPRGRKIFGIAQSWGEETPTGPTIPGCPNNVFGAEWSVVQAMLSQRDSMGAIVLDAWTDFNAWAVA